MHCYVQCALKALISSLTLYIQVNMRSVFSTKEKSHFKGTSSQIALEVMRLRAVVVVSFCISVFLIPSIIPYWLHKFESTSLNARVKTCFVVCGT